MMNLSAEERVNRMKNKNCAALVDEAAGKPRQEVERIVARLDPKPVPQDVTRAPVTGKVEPTQTVVLTETLSRKYMTANREYEDLLSAVRSALSHQMPAASDVDLLMECMRIALKRFEKRKGIVDKPRADREATDGDIPQSVRRAVWKRDHGKCQWRTADGHICGSTHQVEFHHRQDRAKGGLGSVENVMLVCRIHNQYAAEISYGEEYMNAIRRAQSPRQSSDASREEQAPEELQPQLTFT